MVNNMNPILNPRTYAIVSGCALAATAALGIVLEIANDGGFIAGFLEFDWTHDVLHVALAAAALVAGLLATGTYARLYARVFGAVYTLLAVLGFLSADVLSFLGVHLELGENLVHAVIGLWGLTTGFIGTDAPKTVPASARRA
jgi:hypothetical protein